MPASTDGSAEHSTIASTGSSPSRSPRSRTSPCTNVTPGLAQAREVELRAAALERVERHDLGPLRGEREAEVGADEAGAAGHEDAAGHGHPE